MSRRPASAMRRIQGSSRSSVVSAPWPGSTRTPRRQLARQAGERRDHGRVVAAGEIGAAVGAGEEHVPGEQQRGRPRTGRRIPPCAPACAARRRPGRRSAPAPPRAGRPWPPRARSRSRSCYGRRADAHPPDGSPAARPMPASAGRCRRCGRCGRANRRSGAASTLWRRLAPPGHRRPPCRGPVRGRPVSGHPKPGMRSSATARRRQPRAACGDRGRSRARPLSLLG